MDPNKSVQKNYVALKMPRPVAALFVYVQGVLAAMTGNPHFPSPAPALTAIAAALAALQQAEVAAQARTKGAVVVRKAWVEAAPSLQAKQTLAGLPRTRSTGA